MKYTRILFILALFALSILMTLVNCTDNNSSDDDDDDDDDDDNDNDNDDNDTGNGEETLPDKIEHCEPFADGGAWFEWLDDIQQAQYAYLDQFGSGAFVAGKVNIDGDWQTFEIDNWSLTLRWLKNAVARPWTDGQTVLIYMRGDYWDDYNTPNLWVLNEDRETLLYYDQVMPSGNIGDQIGENSVFLAFDYACEYVGNGPPPPSEGWRRVFGMKFDGILDGTLVSGYPQYSYETLDGVYNINLPTSYYGRTDTDEIVTDIDIRYWGELSLQIVRIP